MPTAYGAEFRQDVIDVARKGEAPLAQIAKDFGLSVTTLKRWIAIAERTESGAAPRRRSRPRCGSWSSGISPPRHRTNCG
ncbi:transposase-like protein [Arthrobacter oryzae]|nr:transposase-like protein [Arthrobacter oryzae]